jgi:hypothetical protein
MTCRESAISKGFRGASEPIMSLTACKVRQFAGNMVAIVETIEVAELMCSENTVRPLGSGRLSWQADLGFFGCRIGL